MKKTTITLTAIALLVGSFGMYSMLTKPSGIDADVQATLYPSAGGLRGDVQTELPVAAKLLGLPSSSSIDRVTEVVKERLNTAAAQKMDAVSEACYVLQADKSLPESLMRKRLLLVDKILSFQAASDVHHTNCAGLNWVSPFHLLHS